jgi:hypothetical protein
MWRKTACAAAGLALALAAVYGLTSAQSGGSGLLDLSFLYPQHSTAKTDRLPLSAVKPASAFAISYNLPQHGMTVVAKNPPMPPVVESVSFRRDPAPALAAKKPRQPDVAQKQKLPEGCEPPFSPVTVPSMAHVAARCTS